jgi:hypothetical protein
MHHIFLAPHLTRHRFILAKFCHKCVLDFTCHTFCGSYNLLKARANYATNQTGPQFQEKKSNIQPPQHHHSWPPSHSNWMGTTTSGQGMNGRVQAQLWQTKVAMQWRKKISSKTHEAKKTNGYGL